MTPKIASYLADHAPATPCRRGRCRPGRAAFLRARGGPAAGQDLLCREGRIRRRRSCSASSRSAPASTRRAGKRFVCASTPAPTPRRSRSATPSRRLPRSPAPMPPASACSRSIPTRSLTSWRCMRRARVVYCRLLVQNEGAEWPLSRKFGTSVAHARALMLRARDLGLDPYGLSFHVGSQQTDTAAYEAAIGRRRCCSPISPPPAWISAWSISVAGSRPATATRCRRSSGSPMRSAAP